MLGWILLRPFQATGLNSIPLTLACYLTFFPLPYTAVASAPPPLGATGQHHPAGVQGSTYHAGVDQTRYGDSLGAAQLTHFTIAAIAPFYVRLR